MTTDHLPAQNPASTESGSAASLLYSPVLAVLLFLICLLVALGYSRLGHSDAQEVPLPPALMVETLGATNLQQLVKHERFIARVEAGQQVELGFEVASVVTGIEKREGEGFKQGELLAILDTRRLAARQAELQAQLARMTAMHELAKSSLVRAEGLREGGNISEQALDEAYRQKEAARADRDLVLAQLQSIDVELDKSSLYAPFDGVVIERMTDVGRTVVVGVPILRIEQSGVPEIKVSVPLQKAKQLKLGDEVAIGYPEGEFSGRIERINLSLSSARVSQVYIEPLQDAPELVAGELLQVGFSNLDDASAQGFWLPLSALTEYGRGLWSVYLARPFPGPATGAGSKNTARIERTVVEIERMQGDLALVSGGLHARDLPHVLSKATHRVVAGQTVRVQDHAQVSEAH